jgi:hypothetical protein
MKRKSPALLGALLLAATAAQAQFTYTTNNGTITITRYTGTGGAVNIPPAINGLPVRTLGGEAFFDCTGLTSVTIPDSITNMGDGAFAECSKLKSVTIPDSITIIGENTFSGCAALSGITLPKSIVSIEDGAFEYCGALTSITISESVTNIGLAAFSDCSSLTMIGVDAQNAFYSSLNGVLFDKNQTSLLQYPGGIKGGYTVPNSATNIGAWAFQGSSAAVVTIPASVSSIGSGAFEDCYYLSDVFFKGNAPTYGWDIFSLVYNATVYYTAGTAGWSSTFAGLPAFPGGPGSLEVTISPAAVIQAGAKWEVDGGEWRKSGATATNLSPGDHAVNFNTVTGWLTPASQSVYVTNGPTATAIGTYLGIGSLKVALAPAAAVTAGAQWQVDGGIWQTSGATVSGLPAGGHILSFNTISGWATPSNQPVSIKTKLVTNAKGTYTFSAQGIYNGLFMQPDVTEETAGMVSGLDVTASGTYSGKLLIGGSTNAISGGFDVSGQASNYVHRTAKQGGPLMLEMTLNWNDSPPEITGTVSGTNGGVWVANLTNELAAKGSSSMEYTALVLPAVSPPGCGYMLMTNHAGAVTLSVTLADGTSFSQAVPLSGMGDLPVYGNLYRSTGLLLGWISLESGAPAGNLTWIKKASRPPALYSSGFTNLAAVQGSPWTNPLPHTAAIDLLSGHLDISGGALLSPLSFNVAVSSSNTLVKLTGGPTNLLSGSINSKGLLTIKFGNGAGKATTAGTGAVLQNATNAGGFFLGKTNAGSILLQP